MLELNKTYKLGKKTFWMFFLKYAKWMVLFSILILAFVWSAWFGRLADWSDAELAKYVPYLPKYMPTTWLLLLAFSSTFFGFLRAHVMYRQYKFLLDETALHVRRGLFNIKQIVIPYQQIQNVEIRQPILHRFFGLAAIDIIVPSGPDGNNAAKNLLPVIDKRIAGLLAHEIIKRGSWANSRGFDTEDYEMDGSQNVETGRRTRRRH